MAYATVTKTLENLTSLGGNKANLSAILIENSHSTANNTSNVTITAALYQKTGSYAQYSAPMLYVDWWDNVSNKWVNKASLNVTSINRYDTVSATATFDVSHATDGKLKGKVRARWVYDGSGSWPVQSGTVETDETELYTIPRYFTTMSISLGTRTDEYSLPIKWSTSETCDYVWYSLDSGSNWIAVGSANGTSGSFTISGLSAGTSYKPFVRCRRKDSQLSTDKNGTWSTYPYPSVTAVGGVTSNHEYTISTGAIPITLNNPLNRSCTVYMRATGETTYTVSNTTSGSSASISPSASSLYGTIKKASSGAASYYCVYADNKGNHTSSSITGVYKCNDDDCWPDISNLNFRYKDLNAAVTAVLNGNDQFLVQGQSRLGVMFDAATAMNQAEIVEYRILLNNNLTGNIPTAAPTDYIDLGLVNTNKDLKVSIIVADSRGYFTTTEFMNVDVIPWSKPAVALSAERENNFNTTTTITSDIVNFVQLKLDNDTETDYNLSRRSLILNYCEGSTYNENNVLEEDGIPVSIINGIPQPIELELDQNKNYIFKITLQDAFDKGEAYALVNRGIPIMMVDGKQLGVGINCFPDGKGLYLNGYRVPVITYGTGNPSGGETGDIYIKIS